MLAIYQLHRNNINYFLVMRVGKVQSHKNNLIIRMLQGNGKVQSHKTTHNMEHNLSACAIHFQVLPL